MSKWVLFYDSADDVGAKAPGRFPLTLPGCGSFTAAVNC
jgi:hypothetical protein